MQNQSSSALISMHPKICFYFQVHQPYRLRDLRITEIGEGDVDYFDAVKNEQVFRKVAEKCYLPANALMLDLINKYPNFHITYSLSGVFVDQCKEYGEDVLTSFKKLADTGKVEFLAETYYHSLASIVSLEEYCEEIKKHVETIQELFGVTPKVFRNTELIYNNEIAQIARLMGFKGIIAEGADAFLQGRNPNDPFRPPTFRLTAEQQKIVREHRPLPQRTRDIAVLLKNYKLSDDVAFRFSDKSWVGYPLDANTFTDWLMNSGGQSVNLFMDYETFGEHQWSDTGIFEFLRTLPAIWEERGIEAVTPSQIITDWKKEHAQEYDVHTTISWADMERDLSAWTGNHIQNAALHSIYELEEPVKATGNERLIEAWRKLLTSDHFYYMCTKYWSDGDVHKYFSPYDSPYEAYRRYSHAIHDLRSRLSA